MEKTRFCTTAREEGEEENVCESSQGKKKNTNPNKLEKL